MQITEAHAVQILALLDRGLVRGLGRNVPGEMCVEAVVCQVLESRHDDDPICVSRALRQLKIILNDACWSSSKARADGLRRVALAQLGSAGVLDEVMFSARCAILAISTVVPAVLEFVAACITDPHKTAFLLVADKCRKEKTARAAADAARAAATYVTRAARAANAARAAADAARAAAYVANAARAAADAARAVDAARAAADAARAATYVANAAAHAAANAANAANADAVLSDFAEGVVQILIDMKAPGCQWLYLAPVSK